MPSKRTSRARPPPRSTGSQPRDRPHAAGGVGADETTGGPAGSKLAPGLHLVATPIGHLSDLSPRALETLVLADLVLCEDTRVTGRLLAAHGHRRRLEAYHEHNAERMRPRALEQLEAGAAVALASDAGTPLVSDPGYKLVRGAIAANIRVVPVPGPSAALAALVVSGLPTDRFLVQGFLPASGSARARALAELAPVKATLVLFESARRLPHTLADLALALGPRPAAVARELTKHFEEVRRAPLDQLASSYALSGPPRGETVIVIGPPEPLTPVARPDAEIDAALGAALQTMPAAAAASEVARVTGRPRRELYRRAVELKTR